MSRRTRQLGQMLRVWLLFPPAHTCPTPPANGWGGLWVTACPRVCCVHHLLRLSATPASSVIVDRPVWSSLFVHNSSSSLANPDKETVRRLKMFRTFETNGIVGLIDLNNLLTKRGTVSFQNREIVFYYLRKIRLKFYKRRAEVLIPTDHQLLSDCWRQPNL